jgi:uncharacterized membrane protein YozB (DUF420 family)
MQYAYQILTFSIVLTVLTIVAGIIRFANGEPHKHDHIAWRVCSIVTMIFLILLLCVQQKDREFLHGIIGDGVVGMIFLVIAVIFIIGEYSYRIKNWRQS